MPLYEYQCDACHHRFERIQKFSDPPVDVCPQCGKGPVQKLLSSPAIQFKGSGWYVTDYAKKSSSEPKDGKAATDSKDASKSSGASSATGESSSATGESSASPAKPAEASASAEKKA
jgi:putative FmdB family regulatory protein